MNSAFGFPCNIPEIRHAAWLAQPNGCFCFQRASEHLLFSASGLGAQVKTSTIRQFVVIIRVFCRIFLKITVKTALHTDNF
jgi:hypothetical protein